MKPDISISLILGAILGFVLATIADHTRPGSPYVENAKAIKACERISCGSICIMKAVPKE